MHRRGEGEILEHRIPHRLVTTDAVIGRTSEQHELAVGEGSRPLLAVHPVGREHAKERDRRGWLHDRLPPVIRRETGERTQQVDSPRRREPHRGPEHLGLEVHVGVGEEQPVAGRDRGAGRRRVTLARPVVGTVIQFDHPHPLIMLIMLIIARRGPQPRKRVVGAPIKHHDQLEGDVPLGEHAVNETLDDPRLVVRRHDDRHLAAGIRLIEPLGELDGESIDPPHPDQHEQPVDAGPETERRERDREHGDGGGHGPGMVPGERP